MGGTPPADLRRGGSQSHVIHPGPNCHGRDSSHLRRSRARTDCPDQDGFWLKAVGGRPKRQKVFCFGDCDVATRANVQAVEQEKKMSENVAGESPIACNLNALDKEQRGRHQSLTEQLRAAAQETRELPD